MKPILAIILFVSVIYPQQAKWWNDAGAGQRTAIKKSYDDNKEYDQGFMLAAFNPIESAGGLFLVKTKEKSAGQYGQRAYNVAKRIKKHARLRVPFEDLWKYYYKSIDDPNEWEMDRAFQLLIVDREFDDRHARAHIDEMLDRFDGDWMKVAQAWNGQKEGQAEEVMAWISFFRYDLKWE